jgi:hypothetical protein
MCKVHLTKLSTKYEKNFISKFVSFFAGVVDIADKHSFANISGNFWKNSKWSYWDTQGPGGHWFMKKIWCRKSRVRLPLSTLASFKNWPVNLGHVDLQICTLLFQLSLSIHLDTSMGLVSWLLSHIATENVFAFLTSSVTYSWPSVSRTDTDGKMPMLDWRSLLKA